MTLLGYSVPETLTDDAGNSLKAVTVTVTGPSSYSGTATSNATSGLIRLGPLPIGDYTLTYQGRSVTVPVVAQAADVQAAYDAAATATAGLPAEAAARVAGDAASVATAAADATAKVATETTRATTAEGLLAPLASPALTGNPTAPTQTVGNSSTRVATTAFTAAAVAAQAVVDSGSYALPSSARVGLIGDSITFINASAGALNSLRNSNGYWNWANVLLGHRMHLTYLDGQGSTGCTDSGWSARVATLAATDVDLAVVQIGTNDVNAGQSTAAITAALDTTITTLRAAGKRVLLLTVPPRDALSTAARTVHGQVNGWIRQVPATRRGVHVADIASWLTNPASSTPATYAPGLSADGTHPLPAGARLMGTCIAQVLTPIYPAQNLLVPQSDAANVLPYITTSWGGGNAGVPTYWGGTTTGCTFSQTTRPDGAPGVVQRIVVPTSGVCALSTSTSPPDYAVGDRLVGFVELIAVTGVETSPSANSQYMCLDLETFNTSFAVTSIVSDLYRLDSTITNSIPPSAGVLLTPPMLVPTTGTQQVTLALRIGGGGTYDLGRVGIVKVGTGY